MDADPTQVPPADPDPIETAEWLAAFDAVLAQAGPARARQLLDHLAQRARQPAVGWEPPRGTAYVNSIPVDRQPAFPGDLAIEERLASIMRWNALAMVVRANRESADLGRHIATCASISGHRPCHAGRQTWRAPRVDRRQTVPARRH